MNLMNIRGRVTDMAMTKINQSSAAVHKRRLAGHGAGATPYLFLTPSLLFFLVFFVFPALFTLYLSLHEWDMLGPISDMRWKGLSNYTVLLSDGRFLKSLADTLLYTLGCLILIPPVALAVALLLNAAKHGAWLWRTLYFLPVVTSIVAMSVVWAYLFDPTYGPINEFLGWFHIPSQGWIASPHEALFSIVVVTVWQYAGYYAILYLAGIQGIPDDYYEAAQLDGANFYERFRFITLPLLKPTHIFVLVMIAINSLQVFTQVFMITGGGPNDGSNVMVLYMYQTAFQFLHMGKASAMAVVLFVIVLLVTIVQFKLLGFNNDRGRTA